jgi:hypothetical protein
MTRGVFFPNHISFMVRWRKVMFCDAECFVAGGKSEPSGGSIDFNNRRKGADDDIFLRFYSSWGDCTL